MDTNNKAHAKDYLLEFKAKSATPRWLASLVQKCVEVNGKFSEEEKDNIFIQLLQENKLGSSDQSHNQDENKSSQPSTQSVPTPNHQWLTIKKITHVKGVNALIPNQAIMFSQACTIIFGLNGTGKSGYFRIIHELAGGAKHKSILNNIHGQENGLEVDVEYSLDGTSQTYKWQDKHQRGISPFNTIKVFDSEYLPLFLNERESSVNIEPLGLNLFHVITSVMDEFKDRLERLQQEQENKKPDLQSLLDLLHSQDFKYLLQLADLSASDKQLLENNTTITKEELEKLDKLKQQKLDLSKKNTDDTKKVLVQERTEVDSLKNHLTNVKTSLESQTKQTSRVIVDYVDKKKARDNRAKQFELIRNVPSRESEEWYSFIKAANEYGMQIDQQTFSSDKICLYCHQPLSNEALTLIKTYSRYLSDQSQKSFSTASDNIATLQKTLENVNPSFDISENLKTILTDTKTTDGQDLYTLVNQILKEAKKQKANLSEVLNKKGRIRDTYSLDLMTVDTILSNLSTQRTKTINELGESEAKKQNSIVKIEAKIGILEDKKNISMWKTKIEDYFAINTKSQKYESVLRTINTRGVTELGSKAHEELLTDSIRKSFENMLKALGKDVEVTLEKTGAGKGTVRTCLKILGNDVQAILSDGEQKAVCLALFLGEIESLQGSTPVVFDDPVTSVDHEVADLLAKKLLQISKTRQVVIFTHNKLFYDSLYYWGGDLKDDQNRKTHHVCKNYVQGGCNNLGCHVYTYTADRESKERTGRIYERQNESCKYFIDKAGKEMKGTYTISSVSGYLKSAIEYYIDEKILNSQGLLKDRRRKITIQWDEIKKINIEKTKIDKLKEYWDQLSDRGSHSTQNSHENPLKAENLLEIIKYLKN